MKIEYITGNLQKFEEAEHILDSWSLERVDLDLQEIQGNRFEIIEAKAKAACAILKKPLIVEDVSLLCSAIGNLPGPYIKDFLEKLGDQGIYDLISRYDDRSAQAICMVAFIKPGHQPVLFEGMLTGTIVAPRGATKHGTNSFNPIFQPRDFDKTMGELSIKEHAEMSFRRIALLKLKEYLEKNSQH